MPLTRLVPHFSRDTNVKLPSYLAESRHSYRVDFAAKEKYFSLQTIRCKQLPRPCYQTSRRSPSSPIKPMTVIAPLENVRKGMIIPAKSNRKQPCEYDRHLDQARHSIKNFFNKLRRYRAIAPATKDRLQLSWSNLPRRHGRLAQLMTRPKQLDKTFLQHAPETKMR